MYSELNREFLRPVQSDEFLPPISRWTTLGGLFIVGSVGTAVSLAAVTKYNVTVKAAATVRPVGELRIAQASTEGTVKSIKVEANQMVKEEDVIAYIDDSQLQTKKSQLQTNIQQNQLQLAQLDAQTRFLERQIAAEKDRMNRAVASAAADLSRIQSDYRERQITAQTQVQEADANLRLAFADFQKAQAELTSPEAELKSVEANLKVARLKRDRYQPLVEPGAISLNQFEEAQLAVEQQEQAVESQKGVIEANKQAIKRQQQAVEVAQARRLGALAALHPSEATVAIAREKIAQERASGDASIARLNQEREALLQRKAEIQNQLSRDRQELQQIETELKNTVVRAPTSGIIQRLNLRNTQQVVRPGDDIAEIVPSDSPLLIKAMVTSEDIGKVKTGQAVQMRVSACPYPNYGTLKGTVSAISPDAITLQGNDTNASQRSNADTGGTFYEVTIQPESTPQLEWSAGGSKCAIRSGMEGRADIISKEETVLTFMLRKARLLTDL